MTDGHNKYTTAELVEREFKLEQDMIQQGREQYLKFVQQAQEQGRNADLGYARKLTDQLLNPCVELVKLSMKSKRRAPHTQIFEELTPEVSVLIGLRTLFNSLCITREETHNPTVTALSVQIGEALQLELKLKHLLEVDEKYVDEVMKDWQRRRATDIRYKAKVTSILYGKRGIKWKAWSTDDKAKAGRYILECLLKQEKVLTKSYQTVRNRKQVFINFTDEALEWLEGWVEHHASLKPMYRPMITHPNDWSDKTKPYLLNAMNDNLQFVRVKDMKSKKFYKTVNQSMYEAVNKAQQTAWRINNRLLNFVQELRMVKNPVLLPTIETLDKPAFPIDTNLKPEQWTPEQKEIVTQWKHQVRDMYSRDVRNRSNRQRANMVISIANDYKDYDQIFFPHSIDSRGRIYSIPTVLQPQGDDLCKGLLEFSKGYKLTTEGVEQLKIQIASKYGLDKESHQKRLSWFRDNEKYLLNIASEPLNHLDFLKDVDKPFQFLSALFDYHTWYHNRDALIHARVNKDGACNGLQHFAMMLADGELGSSVNLRPSKGDEDPKSIYKVVAQEVDRLLKQDNCFESRMWRSFWDEYNEGKVDYKCMKRPVMTLPYSATMFSRRDYIADYVNDVGGKDYFGDKRGDCLTYFVTVVTKAMDNKIPSACKALKWLSRMCREVLQDEESVQWETPLGFTVYNRKAVYNTRKVYLQAFGKSYMMRIAQTTSKVNIRKVCSAIAPNFIHSLDACHMLMIVNKCHSLGITDLHLVHDDYGCHANFGGILTEIAKEEFLSLYTNHDPIQDFYDRYEPDLHVLEKLNTFDREEVLQSVYAFD